MKVRAVAAPSKDSTAVGTLELECTPHGLVMVYLAVAAYRDGYAPGAVTRDTRCVATWSDVLDVRAQADAILLSVNPSLTPHHRLCLTHFTEGQADERELKKRRWLLRLSTLLLMLAVAFSLSASLPVWSPRTGQITAFGLGVTAAVFVLGLGLFAEKLWLPEPASHEQVLERFKAELLHYRPLPILPSLPGRPEPERTLSELLQLLPRSTTAIVIVLTASSLAAVLTSAWILGGVPSVRRAASPELPVESVARAHQAPAGVAPLAPAAPDNAVASDNAAATAAPDPSVPPASGESAAQGATCRCDRADSILWRLPFPRLSTLMIAERIRPHQDHHHIELELAVVNNGNQALKEIGLIVQFFEDEGKTPTKDRPLYYESWLRPGQAIKWHVEARGTSFVIHNPNKEVLGEGELATAADFADLLNANHRPVRLHGAMMLAYLGDERAKGGAVALREALREEEGPYLDRVIASRATAYACDIRLRKDDAKADVELCVFNRGAETQSDLGLKLRVLDSVFDHRSPVAEPPIVVAEKVFRLPGEWPAAQGRWVTVTLDVTNPDGRIAESAEAFVDAWNLMY